MQGRFSGDSCNNFIMVIQFMIIMKSLEILERKIREFVDKNARAAEEHNRLLEEIKVLRENVASLEAEKESLGTRVDNMIRIIEQHLGEEPV